MPTGNDEQQAPAKPPRECGTCLFWDPSIKPANDLPSGLCRRNAPRPAERFNAIIEHKPSGILMAGAVWPITLQGENCGEHKFAPKGAERA